MPDYYLFYQNMHPCFDGSNPDRNSRLEKALQVISGKLKTGRVMAAGFADVQLLDRTQFPIALRKIALHLDVGLNLPDMFATGGYGMPEYTAICVSEKFSVEERGRVMRVNQGKSSSLWKCVPQEEVPIHDLKRTGDDLERTANFGDVYVGYFEARTRGLAYVCGKFDGRKMVVGFTHIISAEGRENTYRLLTDVMKLIWDKHPGYSGCPTIFGGDFTFAPGPIAKPYHAAYACKPGEVSTAAPGGPEPLATSNNGGFAFWVANKEVTNNDASLYKETGGPNISHHSGISLRLPTGVTSGEVKR